MTKARLKGFNDIPHVLYAGECISESKAYVDMLSKNVDSALAKFNGAPAYVCEDKDKGVLWIADAARQS